VAKTFQGLEPVLAKELETLGAWNIKILKRAVSFDASKVLLYKANLHLRTALRILQPLTTFTANSEEDLYKSVKAFDWSHFLNPDQTLAIDAITYSDIFKNSKYVSLKTKDAIADQFRERTGKRPSVDIENPTLLINVHIAQNKVTLSLDSSGESLNRRGYRTGEHPSPINEVLAAGMILMTGWDGKEPFIDPMCGSGTFVLEAAMIAANIAPNLKRKAFGFTRWNNFDAELWAKIKSDAEAMIKTPEAKISGSDISLQSIDIARQSALDYGLKQYIHFEKMAFDELKPYGKKGIVVMNPPYGERLKTRDIVQLYIGIGDQLKRNFSGYDAWVISSNIEALKLIGLKPEAKYTLFNGALECRFVKFSLYEGSKKEVKRRIVGDKIPAKKQDEA
jgi:putative N6-adenine-specific DNA methylase